jgi:ComF family protein
MISLLSAFLQLFFPHVCDHCGTDLTSTESVLCLRCQHRLPATDFEYYDDNPVAKLLYKAPHAMAAYYFSGAGMLQQLVHKFKYHQRKDIALQLGRFIGRRLLQCSWLHEINCLVPVPLHPQRQKQRGYNQAALLAAGISEVTHLPVITDVLVRLKYSDTQTHKNRLQRRVNVANLFAVKETSALPGRHVLRPGQHVLLIDDVITTGATTRACSEALQQANITVSVCALAYTGH